MEGYGALLEPFKNIQRSLNPYIQQRHEVARIRRVLASHLNSSLNPDGEHNLPQPLSLVDASYPVDLTSSGSKGTQKEYIRCVQGNIKVRREYTRISKEHDVKTAGRDQEQDLNDDAAAAFLELIKHEQKHRVFQIIQDYIDMLGKKPAATVRHLDPKQVLKDVGSPPQLPPEIINAQGGSQKSGDVNLEQLADQLERSVLRAKILLQREQKLLAEVKSQKIATNPNQTGKLQALGTTRNELINWIETELSRAGENSSEVDEHIHVPVPENIGGEYIEDQLASIRRQYARYAKARQALFNATTGQLTIPNEFAINENQEPPVESHETPGDWNTMSHITYPFLKKLLSVSNDQKTMIQQKSHLTIVLSKQMKEANQGLDRLADESHLLRAYPKPVKASRRPGKELSESFAEGMSKFEKLDSSRRVQPWVYASDSAATATKCAILEKLDEGSMAIDNTQQTVLDVRRLLGDSSVDSSRNIADNKDLKSEPRTKDIWVEINGTLGAIK